METVTPIVWIIDQFDNRGKAITRLKSTATGRFVWVKNSELGIQSKVMRIMALPFDAFHVTFKTVPDWEFNSLSLHDGIYPVELTEEVLEELVRIN